jgi:hypothetical protein
LNCGGIHLIRLFAEQAQQNAAVRAVPHASECQGTEQFHAHTSDAFEQTVFFQAMREAVRGAHRTHGVRARRANANLE